MIVVADTSPINYLVLIDEAEALPKLFDKVIVPQAVLQELRSQGSSKKVLNWVAHLPSWVEVRDVSALNIPALLSLGPGEGQAIQLALELGLDILIDEAEGRKQAELLNLTPHGTLAILEDAPRLGSISFREALAKLLETSFRASPALIAMFLDRNA